VVLAKVGRGCATNPQAFSTRLPDVGTRQLHPFVRRTLLFCLDLACKFFVAFIQGTTRCLPLILPSAVNYWVMLAWPAANRHDCHSFPAGYLRG
jgi:hypothetical protein